MPVRNLIQLLNAAKREFLSPLVLNSQRILVQPAQESVFVIDSRHTWLLNSVDRNQGARLLLSAHILIVKALVGARVLRLPVQLPVLRFWCINLSRDRTLSLFLWNHRVHVGL